MAIVECAKLFGTFLTLQDLKAFWKAGNNANLLFAAQLLDDFPLTSERIESKIRAEVGDDVELINVKVLTDVIKRAATTPDSTLLGINAAVEQVRELAASSASTRKKNLQDKLAQFGLSLRSDSGLCKQFIEGSCSCPLGQVVGIMRIASKLFSYSHRHWSVNRGRWESALFAFAKDATTWDQATNKALALPVSSPAVSSRTCWKCGDPDHLSYDCWMSDGEGY